jgi:hypothetical protein
MSTDASPAVAGESLPKLDWPRIIADFEAARNERAALGKPGTTVLEVNEPAPGVRDRRPVHRVWTKMPAGKK